jgi:hypothetical protein
MLIFTRNFVGSLDVRASRKVFPIESGAPKLVQIQKRTAFVIACPAAVVKAEEFFTFDVIFSIMPGGEPETHTRRLSAMSKFEKRLCIVALVFVAIYLGAAVITIKYRISKPDRIERLESRELSAAEGQLLMAELFLPVMILLTLTICYIVVRKTRAKKRLLLDEPDEETDGQI